ncbi:hypothetical protein LLG46_02165 [bacterium]|nr:hypothetical protein [bacterium]
MITHHYSKKDKIKNEHFQRLREVIKLAKRTSDLAKSAMNCEEHHDESHMVNENTLIRVYDDLDFILSSLKLKERKQLENACPDYFGAYVTLYACRTSIVHNRGLLQEKYRWDEDNKDYCNKRYKCFCISLGMEPVEVGEKLKLPVREPDFLINLFEQVEAFAEAVLVGKNNGNHSSLLPSQNRCDFDSRMGTGVYESMKCSVIR